MPDPLPAPPATFPLRLPGVAWWACFLCVFMLRRSRFFCLALIRLAGARRRPCTVRNGRWALPLKRLPSTPLLTGLPPRFFRHWRRSAPPPRPGAAAPGPRKKTSTYFSSRLLLPLLWRPAPILARLPRRSCSRRPCGPFFFIAGGASYVFSLPPPWLHPLTKKMARKAAFCRSAPDGPGLHSPPRNRAQKKKPPNPGAFPCEKNCTCNSFSERMLKP